MITYSFEGITVPLYEHLYRCLKKDIESGLLKAGVRLPSKRAFAKNLGVSTVTVQGAYDQLRSEGYIHSEPKHGYFVEAITQKPANSTVITDSVSEPKPTAQVALPVRFELSGNHTDPECFPFSVWSKLMRETARDRTVLLTRYRTGGMPELQRAVAKHLAAFRGFSPAPEQIIIGAGAEYLYGLVIELLGNDKVYCLENPGYRTIERVYRSHGARVTFAGLDESGLCVTDLMKSAASIVHVSPTHHFPTGIDMPAARRYELLAWAAQNPGHFIIEDDYDSEFRLVGRPIPALQSIDTEGRVIYINTFSKTLASTVRLAYMVLPPSLLSLFESKLGFYASTVSNFEQSAVAKFIERGYFEKHINRMRTHYAKQREAVLRLIAQSPLAPFCRVFENPSGLHFLIELKTTLSDCALTDCLYAQGVGLCPLSSYYVPGTAQREHVFFFSYSNIDLTSLPQALRIIAASL